MAALAAVVALVLIVALVARRWLGRMPLGSHRHPIQIVASRTLGGRASLMVVEVEGERLLLGSSPHGLGLICKLAATAAERADDDRFAHLLTGESPRASQ